MKFSCDSCHARYTIADEKVRGKILRVRCKKCGSSIILKEPEEEVREQPAVREDDATHVIRAEEIRKGLAAQAEAPIASPKFVSRRSGESGVGPPPHPKEKPEWYVLVQKEEIGPLRIDELRERATTGKLTPRTYVWRDGMANWARAQTVPELNDIIALIPASAQRPTTPPPPAPIVTSAVFRPAPFEEPASQPTASDDTASPENAQTQVPAPSEVTPKDRFESTIPSPAADARMVPAPVPVDPSTLKTEILTPSREDTVLALQASSERTDALPSKAEAAVEAAPQAPALAEEPEAPAPSLPFALPSDPPVAAATEPPADPYEEDLPVLFGLDKARGPSRSAPPAEPLVLEIPKTEPPPAARPEPLPLPSVLVNLDAGVAPEAKNRHAAEPLVSIESGPSLAAGPTLLGSRSEPPKRPSEPSASFLAAVRPSLGRRLATIGLPVLIVAGLLGLYFHRGDVPPAPTPAPVVPEPDKASPPAPTKAVKKEPSPKAVPKSAPTEAPRPEASAPKHVTEERAAFAAVQQDSSAHRLDITPKDFLHTEEQDLNPGKLTAEVDEALLARKVKQVQPAIEHCVTSETRRNENFHVGKLKVNLVIAPSGDVTEVTFDKRSVTDGSLGDCLRPAFKNIRMPPHEGEAQRVEIPLSLP